MTEEYERTVALLDIVHPDPVGMGVTVSKLGCHFNITSKVLRSYRERREPARGHRFRESVKSLIPLRERAY
jgi:hypothetical protein